MSQNPAGSPTKNRLIKNLVFLYASQIMTGILSLAPIAFVPRYLDAVGVGKLTIAVAFSGILGKLIVLGSGAYTVREIARDERRLPELLTSSIVLRLGLALLMLPVTVGLLGLSNYPADTNIVVLIMYSSLVVRMISLTLAEALQALEEMRWRAMASIVAEVVAVGLGWFVLHQSGSIMAYAAVHVLAAVAELVVHAAYFVVRVRVHPVVRVSVMREVFYGGLPFFLWAFIQTIYFHTSSLMLSKLGGEEAVGWYGAANQFIIPLFMIPSVAITVMRPRFAKLSQSGVETLRPAVVRSMGYITMITMPMAFGLAAVSKPLIELFNYPSTFAHSIPVLQVLAFMLPGTSLLMVAGTAIAAMNKERAWARVSIFSLVAAVLLNGLLIPAGGALGNAALGAAWAGLLVEILTYGWALFLLGRAVFDPQIFITFGKATLAAGVMAGVILAVQHLPLPVLIAIGAFVYVALILVLDVLPSDDLVGIRGSLAHRWQRASVLVTTRFSRSR